jgi:basic membrane protein A
VKQRPWSRLLLILLAAFALVLASCASDDDDEGSGGGGGGGGGSSEEAATCEGETGQADEAEPLGTAGEADGAGQKIGMVFDVGGKGDKSFNDSAFAGLTAAAENLGVEVKELEPSADGSNREALMRQLADEGYNLIIGVGFAFAEVMPGIVADYPGTEFAIVDSVVEAPNVTSIVFAEEQGSYLVGAAAAQASKTGTVGFVGGVDTELIKKFEAGYTAGAEAVNPDVQVEVKYLSTGDDFSGFDDAAAGETTAAGLYEAGADVVYHAAGASGAGVFKAATEADRLAIGVDSNQYLAATEAEQACILTSMLKRVDVAVYETIKNFVGGQAGGETVAFSLEDNGIGYATQGGQIVDEQQLEQFKEEIIAGEIEVPQEP